MHELKVGGASPGSKSPSSIWAANASMETLANMVPISTLSALEQRAQAAEALGRREVSLNAVEARALVAELKIRRKTAERDHGR